LPPRKTKEKLPDEISAQEAWDVVTFAKNMYNLMPGVYTPDLVNSRMKDINMNPIAGTANDIETALKNPQNSEEQLRGFSEYFEYTNMIYKRTLHYMSKMLAFDYTFTCTNAQESDYNSAAYKKDKKIVYDFLDKFDVKREFKRVMNQMLRHDVFYSILREDGDKYVLQELPIKRCKLTGRWDYGLLFDFDMMWFIANPGVDIMSYPPIFRKFYKRISDDKNNGYRPSGDVNRSGEWVYWCQTAPEDNFWAWKLDPDQAGAVPFLSPMFPDLAMTPLIRNLQKNKYIIQASRILVGLIPLLKDAKSGNIKDMFAIDPKVAGQFAQLIRAGLPEAISLSIAPFEDIKQYDFGMDQYNILEDHNKNIGASSGINSRLIYGLDKQNAEETRNSIAVDEYLLTYIYPYFSAFLEYHINRKTKKFKFKFEFEGTEFYLNKQTRLDNAMKLATVGIVLPQKISAAIGMEYKDFERQLAQGRADSFVDKLTPMITAYTNSGKQGAGAPQKATSDLSDGGAESREYGSNLEKGGKV
jgi:hypothetical protein